MRKQIVPEKTYFSVVIPVFNEAESVVELIDAIEPVFKGLKAKYELVFVDDGSTDETLTTLIDCAKHKPNLKVIEQRRNFGKALALDSGFRAAEGDIVITMDGDLQDDPKEIPRMIEKINEGFDLVSGWKQKRHDPWHKTLPSKLFNFMTSKLSGVKLNDFNCGFKMYRREVVKSIRIYGEMHRYIPALAYWRGFLSGEIAVEHHARKYGKSKYGIERFMRGLFDFITIAFITKYNTKPMHFFGNFGFLMSALGIGIGLYLSVLWSMREFFGYVNIGSIGDRPLLLLSVLLITVGMLFFATGLLGEMMLHHDRHSDIEPYVSREIHKGSAQRSIKKRSVKKSKS